MKINKLYRRLTLIFLITIASIGLTLTVTVGNIPSVSPVKEKTTYESSVSKNNNVSDSSEEKLTFMDSLDALNYAFSGYEFSCSKDSGIFKMYNYQTKTSSDDTYFDTSFSLMATFQATGDLKYLDVVKRNADYLSTILPSTGLIPTFPNKGEISTNPNTYLGGKGQLQAVQTVAFLAHEDKKYLPLMYKLTNALITYGINPSNNLTWYQVNTLSGKEAFTIGTSYETQLGQNCSNCAQSLLIAYKTDPSKLQYKQKALDILKAVWKCRDKSNNLIPEVWDVKINKPGKNLYPYSDFRYDDMGGAYIRALTLAYQVTKDKDIIEILNTYSSSLVEHIWDKNFNGGGFRYMTHLDGTPSAQTVETMYGLFIGTLLEAEKVLDQPKGILYQSSLEHANNIFVSGFGLKNNMVPHQLNGQTGEYWGSDSTSQLNYAAIQFPLGMELLSQESGNSIYRLISNRVINKFLDHSKVGDNINEPNGYVDITETQPPYGFDLKYGSPSYMAQIFYLPTYILFNSIHPSAGVSIDWQNDLPIGVFGLVSNMPFFDRDLVDVNVNAKTICFSKVTGSGTIDLGDMGFGYIKKVMLDNQNYNFFTKTKIITLSGTHRYQVFWN
ncbi:hypothetical protein DEAC_c18110 [Desulfosporosinus acididurans]|uniref:Uncharacterized protein n=1 Tax=Desulfosporosinus acididurans TaxID=476652 RepID=A0A0J1FSY1_9FIRM|nr:hypothetical protein [Desulfosporosinus acididurans]KLU66412.1 hypothetical protein DEAC_c18110 [Desulfosporosinus acididurans]